MAMRNSFRAALWLALILSLSHPFTGLQFLLILLAWCGVEIGFLRNKTIPFMFPDDAAMPAGVSPASLTTFSCSTLVSRAPRRLFVQWSPARARAGFVFLLAYISGRIFVARLRRAKLDACPLNSSQVRPTGSLMTWFLISFILVHHDLMHRAQGNPLHFSRGIHLDSSLSAQGSGNTCLRMLEKGVSLKKQDSPAWHAWELSS